MFLDMAYVLHNPNVDKKHNLFYISMNLRLVYNWTLPVATPK